MFAFKVLPSSEHLASRRVFSTYFKLNAEDVQHPHTEGFREINVDILGMFDLSGICEWVRLPDGQSMCVLLDTQASVILGKQIEL